jgi:hypothetical protein
MPEIEQASVTVQAESCTPERAERVSRMIFQHLEKILTRECGRAGASRVVPHLHVPSLEVEWGSMDDDAIARAGATWIYRWLKATE